MGFEIVKLTEEKHKAWNNFCLISDDAWFWHTTDWLNYTLNYQPALKTKNLSFLVYKQKIIKAIIPLTLEIYSRAGKNYNEFTFGGFAIPAPALANKMVRIEKDRSEEDLVNELIFKEIDRLAEDYKVMRVWLRQTPLAPSYLNKKIFINNLIKLGFMDVSLNTRLIDLHRSEDDLWKDLRRNHRRNIRKAEKFQVLIYAQKDITKEIFSAYKALHKKAAGRQTRPDITFDLMYDWLERNLAFLAAVKFENKFIGFEYYSVYKNNVYGFSAANDPDYEKDYPIRHLLEWEAILWMKKNNFDFYEIGLQQFGALLHDFPDKKQLDISHFKKGFGGFLVPWFMGEKFYDKEYFLTVYQERIKKYADYLNKSTNLFTNITNTK